ncbi:tetratricopeptide repeat protein [Sanguibacter suaedae]|uniref:Tetratricopeptide repeat protein n=1 Tax=Sanguibacter suaedae TaxID=2795737 RepID=A0A934IDN5_9MICO|nr:tetratricopeptide repeat protein [Sanguibacter suaedae]MBI9116078.1 tetratricopeptide repeat protein [Sanguibacter suaedae]
MTVPGAPGVPGPAFDVRGAVDLSSLGRPKAPPPGEPGGAPAAGGFVVDVTDEMFPTLVQQSAQVPVVALLWLPTDAENAKLATDLAALTQEYGGRFLLARIDAAAYPQIAQAFQVQAFPTVVAILAQQPVPLFQGTADQEQVRGILDQILEAAQANGVTGVLSADGAPAPAAAQQAEPEPALPPLHQKAYDAIDADDLDTAVAAYEQALREDPRDSLASAGLAQVRLLQRTRDTDLAAVRRAAADAPTDIEAQLAVADLDLLGGKVEDAFVRLLDLVPDAPDREVLRKRLVEYFELLGPEDPRVAPARRALANALY